MRSEDKIFNNNIRSGGSGGEESTYNRKRRIPLKVKIDNMY